MNDPPGHTTLEWNDPGVNSRGVILHYDTDKPTSLDLAEQLSVKVEKLDSEFKAYHFSLIDLLEDDEALEKEQEILDYHDEEISALTIRIKQLTKACDSVHDSSHCKTASRSLLHIRNTLYSIKGKVGLLTSEHDNFAILHQYEEQICDLKIEFADIRKSLMLFDLNKTDNLSLSCNLELTKISLIALYMSRNFSSTLPALVILVPHLLIIRG